MFKNKKKILNQAAPVAFFGSKNRNLAGYETDFVSGFIDIIKCCNWIFPSNLDFSMVIPHLFGST